VKRGLRCAALEKKEGHPYLVKEVVPGDNIENISPFRNIRSMKLLVYTVSSDQRGSCDAHYERTVASYRTVIIRAIV